jgi:hypothetical protein
MTLSATLMFILNDSVAGTMSYVKVQVNSKVGLKARNGELLRFR